MSEQQNLDVVRKGYEAFGRGDIDGLLALLDEGVEWVTPGPSSLPTAGKRRGREAIRGFFKTLNEVFEIQRFEPKTFAAQGDLVIVIGDDDARVRATGKIISEPWVHVFTVRNGKVVAFQEILDTAATVAELQSARATT